MGDFARSKILFAGVRRLAGVFQERLERSADSTTSSGGRMQCREMGAITRAMVVIFAIILMNTQVVYPLVVSPSRITEPEGDQEVHFFCFENNGNTQATGITWRDPQNNTYTPGAQSSGDRIVAEGFRLSIYNLVRGDSGGYECFRGSELARADLLIYASPAIINPMPIQEIYFGMTSLLLCQIDPGNPAATVNWLHVTYNGTRTNLELITEDWNPRFEKVENGLQISDVRVTDEGTYRCYVRNDYDRELLDIQASFRESPQFVNDDVQLNFILSSVESASLDCRAAGAPLPNVTWSFPPNSNLGQGPARTNFTLDVRLFDGADAGEYVCMVNNGVGNLTRTFTLSMAMAPQPPTKYRNLTIDFNKEQTLSCNVAALPRPSFEWLVESKPLLSSDWSTNFSDVMGISTLTYKFQTEDLRLDCKMQVTCLATNSYGQSRQNFLLTPADAKLCQDKTASGPSSNPTVSDNNQGQENEKGDIGHLDDAGDEMSGETFKIIVGSFTVAVTVIVVGVVILLVYFLRHFCLRKKSKAKFNQKQSTTDAETGLPSYYNNAAMMSSLHHHQLMSDGNCHNDGAGLTVNRLRSVDSGVSSISSLTPCPNCNHGNIAPPLPSPRGGGGTGAATGDEGIYHRLDHSLSSHSSMGNTSMTSFSNPKRRLVSTSSSCGDSNSVFLQSQCSSTETDENILSVESGGGGACGMFFVRGHMMPRRGPTELQHGLSQSESATSTLHPGQQNVQGKEMTEKKKKRKKKKEEEGEEVGMIHNPSYECHKLKIAVTTTPSSNEPPHIYEKVA